MSWRGVRTLADGAVAGVALVFQEGGVAPLDVTLRSILGEKDRRKEKKKQALHFISPA
jgi:hypothetical protein